MNRVASRGAIAILLTLLLIAGLGFFVAEYVSNASRWVMHPGSPHVYDGGNIGCGKVVDAEGKLLLDMSGGRKYAKNEALRKSTVHWLGDRYGSISAPALPAHAADLAGYELLNGVYAYGDASGTAKLTLMGSVQKAALEVMGDKKGTVAVYNYKTGEVLCMVSAPSYDPLRVPENLESDERYNGAYLNRFLSTASVPGSVYKTVTLAAALEEIPGCWKHSAPYCPGTPGNGGGYQK